MQGFKKVYKKVEEGHVKKYYDTKKHKKHHDKNNSGKKYSAGKTGKQHEAKKHKVRNIDSAASYSDEESLHLMSCSPLNCFSIPNPAW